MRLSRDSSGKGRERPRRTASPALEAFDAERARVLAEYRRRERQAPGSGDLWVATRTLVLRDLWERDDRAAAGL